ncbi:reverse transcriptase domain-containing protein [Streptomyces sp. NPDC052236]|uniref:reverse transcriptase domain-containing protein n=1 Tax=Streptomyces sp. NPDC052236 TaxID=3365686 RepID=UPI0037D97E28
MLKLIRSWLRMGVLEGGVTSPTGTGTPQGSPISPLLANVALHVLDEAWQGEGRRLGVLVRYCDDFVVLSPTRQRAEQAQQLAARVLGQLGMRLHPEKSGITCLTRGGQGFEFLGFHHRKVESWKWRGRFYLYRWPSQRALKVLRDKVRAATSRSRTERPVAAVVAELNPVLRGWAGYFRKGNSARKFVGWTSTSTSGWRFSPARNMASQAGIGPPVTTTGGSVGSGSSACPESGTGRRRMPSGERCRKAGCGRTACPV